MSQSWLVVAVVGAATVAFKAAGPVLVGRRALPPRVQACIELLAPVMLTALVVTQTFGGDDEITVDARVVGVGAALVALRLRAHHRRDGRGWDGDRARPGRVLGAMRVRSAAPEHRGGRDRLGHEAREPDHEQPGLEVPHMHCDRLAAPGA